MYSLCFCFKLLSITFIKGRAHADKNIQLCLLKCYKKLSRLLKVTAGQVSMHERSECICNVRVFEVKEFYVLWCKLCTFPWFFLSIPIKERIILAFISCLQEWEWKIWSLCGLLFYLWLDSSFLREGKLGGPPCFPFPMSLLIYLSPYFLNLWLGYNPVCQQDWHCLSGN